MYRQLYVEEGGKGDETYISKFFHIYTVDGYTLDNDTLHKPIEYNLLNRVCMERYT